MRTIKHNTTKVERRRKRVRSKLFGTAERPRLCVTRTNKYVYLQVIDDAAGKTLASIHQKSVKAKGTKTELATATAKVLAEQLTKAKITKLVFDRGHCRYHGRVKAVAEVMREHKINV